MKLDQLKVALVVSSSLTLVSSIFACAGETVTASNPANDAASDGGQTAVDGAQSAVDGGTVGTSGLTLGNCGGTVDGDVPAFYRSYFRCADIRMSGTDVVITTKGLPPHPSNYYGVGNANYAPFDTSRGAQYKANPNLLTAQNVTISLPVAPAKKANLVVTAELVNGQATGATSSVNYKMGPAGVALDSVILFNPLAAPGDDIENEKYTFDDYAAHPAPGGAYHYHATSKGPLEVLAQAGIVSTSIPGAAEIELYGVMCDGALVLGCTELDGSTPDESAFDAQNGHFHDVRSKTELLLADRYHVHLCPTKFAAHPRAFTPQVQVYDRCAVTDK
jgi:hypothetical protein